MSRYLILFLLNLPFILAAILGAIVSYKMGRVSRRRLLSQVALWLLVLIGLASAEGIYQWLFSNDLTETEPLSLFDVIQITALIILLYATTRYRARLERLEEMLKKLNTEISLRLFEKKD